jgi:flagellin
MTLSVSNSNAILALLNLNNSQAQPVESDSQLANSQPAGAPAGDPAAWSITQTKAADVGGLASATMSLDRATSISDVAAAAGLSITALLQQMKQKALAAQNPALDLAAQQAGATDFKTLLGQINGVADSASFDGANLLNGSLSGDIKFMANADGSSAVTLSVQDMSLGGSIVTLGATASVGTPTAAASALSQINTSLDNVAAALTKLGAQASRISAHTGFVNQLSDVLQAGAGVPAGADLAKEGARLQALQIQQQLGVQSLSIANQTPQMILSLFR